MHSTTLPSGQQAVHDSDLTDIRIHGSFSQVDIEFLLREYYGSRIVAAIEQHQEIPNRILAVYQSLA